MCRHDVRPFVFRFPAGRFSLVAIFKVLSGIRTVASLTSEETELERYGKHLDGAYRAGIKEGMSKGLGNGMLFTSIYLSFALAFWFGTKQVWSRNLCSFPCRFLLPSSGMKMLHCTRKIV